MLVVVGVAVAMLTGGNGGGVDTVVAVTITVVVWCGGAIVGSGVCIVVCC